MLPGMGLTTKNIAMVTIWCFDCMLHRCPMRVKLLGLVVIGRVSAFLRKILGSPWWWPLFAVFPQIKQQATLSFFLHRQWYCIPWAALGKEKECRWIGHFVHIFSLSLSFQMISDSNSYHLMGLLRDTRPNFVVMYDADVKCVRQLEVRVIVM